MLADTTAISRPGRALVRNLFLRLLGVVFVLAFWSLGRQVFLLYGTHGLLPVCPIAARVPVTLFRFACSDALLWWGTVAGAALGVGLAGGLAPRWLLGAAWLLYLSYVGVGQDFLSFQWDNLLLESSLFALFVTPSGWRLRDAPPPHPLGRMLLPARALLDDIRSINAYHLFAQMTLVRREPAIEGSDDGVTWQPYELRYEPGDVDRAPPFVAPHQPRVDFQLWFLLLGGRILAPWFRTLLDRLQHDPAAVAPLFARDPFPTAPPRWLRVAVYRYRFSDAATRASTGAWWTRELEGTTRPIGK